MKTATTATTATTTTTKNTTIYFVFDTLGVMTLTTSDRNEAYAAAEKEGYTIQTVTDSDSLGWFLSAMFTSAKMFFSKVGYTYFQ